jgi:hypothetical protein
MMSRVLEVTFLSSFLFYKQVLLSCKGLVALVIFNIMLASNLVTPVLFAMLVGYIVITTFLYVDANALTSTFHLLTFYFFRVTPLMNSIEYAKTLWVAHREKRKKDKFTIFLLPRTPQMAPPIMTLAKCMNSSTFNKKDLPVEYRVARIVDPNDKYLGIVTRKTFKQVCPPFFPHPLPPGGGGEGSSLIL